MRISGPAPACDGPHLSKKLSPLRPATSGGELLAAPGSRALQATPLQRRSFLAVPYRPCGGAHRSKKLAPLPGKFLSSERCHRIGPNVHSRWQPL